MHISLFLLMSLASALFALTAQAEPVAKDAIPEKILSQIYNKFPSALNISAEREKHFNQDLLEITFKEKEGDDAQNLIKYYRTSGQFYVDGVKVDTSDNANMLPPNTKDSLKTIFSNFTISDAILIVNPNGAGEEFDLNVTAEGVKWEVTIDKNGNIADKVKR